MNEKEALDAFRYERTQAWTLSKVTDPVPHHYMHCGTHNGEDCDCEADFDCEPTDCDCPIARKKA